MQKAAHSIGVHALVFTTGRWPYPGEKGSANEHNQKSLAAVKHTMDLTNQANAAKSTAELDAQKEQVRMLQSQVADLRPDLKAQMDQTREVSASNAAAVAAQNQMMRSQTTMASR